jgi:hypothetical protein
MTTDAPAPRDALLRMIGGYQVSQALSVAATLGLADLLDGGPLTVQDLAEATATDAPALARLMRALASVGVFAEIDDRFALTPLAAYLNSSVPGSLRAWAMNLGQPSVWNTWGHFLDSVRTGQPAFPSLYGTSAWEYREEHPEANAIFNQAMTELSAGLIDAIVESYDFSGIGTLVDVGGGEGALLAAILAANPLMRGILFDQPHVVTTAAGVLEQAGVAGRCTVVEGSFFDAVPVGGDVYILKSILHDWDDASASRILRSCREAITVTGKLCVVDRVIRPGNDPDPAKYMDLIMLVMLGGRERTADEFGQLFAEAGFRLTRIIPTSSGLSVVEGAPV